MKKVAISLSMLILSILFAASINAEFSEGVAPVSDGGAVVYIPIVAKQTGARAALMALYSSTNGPNWRYDSGWGIGNPCIREWHGVRCENGIVTGIALPFNRLSGHLPPELGYLSNLQFLVLPDNQLIGSIPAEMWNLTKLESLILDTNWLTGSIPDAIDNLTNLKVLRLAYNQLNGPIPPGLGNLNNVWELILSGNKLEGLIPPELGNMSRLVDLKLSYNQLNGPIPTELNNLTSLKFLGLGLNPDLWCWQSEVGLNWANGLVEYHGPIVVCP